MFGNSLGNNSNQNLFCALELSCTLDKTEVKAKARKNVTEKKKVEAKEDERVVAKEVKEKKRVTVEVVKEKKRVEVEELKEKKLDNITAENMQTILEKVHISKRKVILLASNPLPKKKL